MNPYMTTASSTYTATLLADNGFPNILDAHVYENDLKNILFARLFSGQNLMNQNNSDAFRQSMGIPLSSMIINCVYNLKACSANDFEW